MPRVDHAQKPNDRGASAQAQPLFRTKPEPPPTAPLVLTPAARPSHAESAGVRAWIPTPEWSLVVVTIGLMWYTARLWGATKALAADTNKAAEKQAKLTRRALRIARQEFLASHRPRLRIRQIEIGWTDKTIRYLISNVGDSDATILETKTCEWVGEAGLDRPVVNSYRPGVIKPIDIPLKSGQSARELHEIQQSTVRAQVQREGQWVEGSLQPIVFWVVVKYRDNLGAVRSTSALAQLNDPPPAVRFHRVTSDTDHNYED